MPLYLLSYTSLGADFTNFNLTVSSGTITPNTATRSQLLSGISVQCNEGVTITVTAVGGPCTSVQTISTPALPPPTYFYFTLQQCAGFGTITGRSQVNDTVGTVFLVGSTCYTIITQLGTDPVSYDYDLDLYDIVPGGCSATICTGGGGTTCDCYSVTGTGSIMVSYQDCTGTTVSATYYPGQTFSTLPGNTVEIVSSSGASLSAPYSCVA